MEQKRINNKLPVAREGLPFIIAGAALAIITGVFHLVFLAIVFSVITLFVVYFFRDPERIPIGSVDPGRWEDIICRQIRQR